MKNYKSDKSSIKEYSYYVFLREAVAAPDLNTLPWSSYLNIIKSFTKIGGCDTKPSIKVSSEAPKLLSGGRYQNTSEKVSFKCGDLEVTEDNYAALRKMTKDPVDIILENKNNRRVTIIKSFRATANLTVQGEDFDIVEITGEQSAEDADDIMQFSVWDKRLPLYFAGSNVRIVSKPNSKINNGLLYSGTDTKIKPPSNENIMNGLYYAG